ncbi:MAG TPA: response regulator transcription factor [Verrucomicrobiota bacterium]|jgi:two-component system response regulator YesN|nr:response regulator transcription factor [Verrucomicrobiota bacterium]OQC27175.1 MAG: Chemotaxis response regulator protein-glutamate methylesterase [Verrucomicrobia bacterium ADurb.Bin063]HRR64746.1 response regulator transcription factor [Candidatus Paceibacterota bacterium]MBP8014000.1 response regulator transcription factor [Verrucomicrobiota bacterium]MDI9373611.1 response regulator transcription factor [Verrucomicrobiota bacterium]
MNNQSAARAARKRAGRQIRIVLVDDSAPARAMLTRLLAPYLQVCIAGQAASGTEGLALADRLQPDLVITDLQMPGVNGLQLVERLRRQHPAMRSLVTSVYESTTCRAACLRHGADAFIGKQRLPEEFPPLLARLFPEAAEPAASPCLESI